MKLLDWLARVGILRYGVRAATYTSAKDRPVEFYLPSVFNAEKDLGVTNNMNPAPCPQCKAEVPAGAATCPQCGRPMTAA